MPNINKVIIAGHLTRDVQLSFLPSQTAVAEFGIATTRKYKKQDGTQGEETCFVDCQLFGKRADVLAKYVKKGSPLLVEGRLKLDSWEAQDGTKRNKMRVFVEDFHFLGQPDNKKEGPAKTEKPEHKPMTAEEFENSIPQTGSGDGDLIPF